MAETTRVSTTSIWRFTAKRLTQGTLLAVGVTLVVFLLTSVVPSNPAIANLGERAASDSEAVAAYNAKHGLDQPLPVQYFTYVAGLLRGDLGTSQRTNRPVIEDLKEFFPTTIELACASVIIALIFGVSLGLIAALRKGGWVDRAVRLASMAGISVPSFGLAVLVLYLFYFVLRIAPGPGQLDPGITAPPRITGFLIIDSVIAGDWAAFGSTASHLVLPAVVLAIPTFGLIVRLTRTAVLEVLSEDYVLAARAKGLPTRYIALRHVLRSAVPSIITAGSLAFGSLLSGAVLVEIVFSWPGVGRYAYTSSVSLDLPAIMGVTLLIALVYITVNLIADLLIVLFDRRAGVS
ncbi:ABC transporter permease [Luethyella okanaganae]|uniref:ABC transporter permease n=1 Tax=Luethyella okanaganae TaxID=69372 RepID=A0ABW1VH96_9MICO